MRNVLGVLLFSTLLSGCGKYVPVRLKKEPVLELASQSGQLTKAAAAGDFPLVKRLVAEGANINEDLGDGTNSVTPLLAAIAGGHSGIAIYLVENHAATYPSFQGFTAHDFAEHLDDAALIKVLEERK